MSSVIACTEILLLMTFFKAGAVVTVMFDATVL